PARDISEPSFRHGSGGDREVVHPGNRELATGDTIDRPRSAGGGKPSEPGEGASVDQFTFSLSRQEFLDLFFDDLELPNLVRNQLGEVEQTRLQRAGYATSGPPSMLSVRRTFHTSLSRRIALGGPARGALQQAQEDYDAAVARGAPEDE